MDISIDRIPFKFQDNWWTKPINDCREFEYLLDDCVRPDESYDNKDIKSVIFKTICTHAFTTNMSMATEVYLGRMLFNNFLVALSICYEPADFKNFVDTMNEVSTQMYIALLENHDKGDKGIDKNEIFSKWETKFDQLVEQSGLIEIVCETFKHIVDVD